MIESNNPRIDVDALMSKIRLEIERHHTVSSALPDFFSSTTAEDASANAAGIEALLRIAEEKALVRTRWSSKLNRFPFTLSRPLQAAFLKGLALLFKDQRHVNFLLIQAMRETLWLNQRVVHQLTQVRRRANAANIQHEKEVMRVQELALRLDRTVTEIEELRDSIKGLRAAP